MGNPPQKTDTGREAEFRKTSFHRRAHGADSDEHERRSTSGAGPKEAHCLGEHVGALHRFHLSDVEDEVVVRVETELRARLGA